MIVTRSMRVIFSKRCADRVVKRSRQTSLRLAVCYVSLAPPFDVTSFPALSYRYLRMYRIDIKSHGIIFPQLRDVLMHHLVKILHQSLPSDSPNLLPFFVSRMTKYCASMYKLFEGSHREMLGCIYCGRMGPSEFKYCQQTCGYAATSPP